MHVELTYVCPLRWGRRRKAWPSKRKWAQHTPVEANVNSHPPDGHQSKKEKLHSPSLKVSLAFTPSRFTMTFVRSGTEPALMLVVKPFTWARPLKGDWGLDGCQGKLRTSWGDFGFPCHIALPPRRPFLPLASPLFLFFFFKIVVNIYI